MDSFGLERSIEPRHALAQQAWKIDNTMTLRSDEVLIDVKIININLASFNEILDETGEDRALLCQRVLEIVRERGKLHNPVTNSGGMLYGTVVELGPSYPNIYHIRPKDEIISLSSLTVTPLHITQILRVPFVVLKWPGAGRPVVRSPWQTGLPGGVRKYPKDSGANLPDFLLTPSNSFNIPIAPDTDYIGNQPADGDGPPDASPPQG